MENMEKKEFYIAMSEWNRFHRPIYFSTLAKQLGISKQAFSQMVTYGTKKRLGQYKEKLKEILPPALYDSIRFPENWEKPTIYKKEKEKAYFSYEEKRRIKEVSWCISKVMYDKVMGDVGFTEYMHDKVMKKVEEAEEWLRKKNATI